MSSKVIATFMLALIVLLSGCGPSEEELNATATQVAAITSAAETAAAPTLTPTSTATPTPTPAPTSTPTPTPIPVTTLLETAFASVNSADSYHFVMDLIATMNAGGTSIEVPANFEGDFQSPDSIEGVSSVTIFNTTIDQRLIIIGETAYVSEIEQETWEELSVPALAILPTEFTNYEVSDIADLTLVGEEELNGEPVYHLNGTISGELLNVTTGDVDGDAMVEYWLGKEDGLLKQTAAVMNLNNIQSFGVPIENEEITAEFSTNVIYSDFGKSVSITTPEIQQTPTGCIAFVSNQSGNDDIYVMNIDGSGLVQLTDHPAMDSFPAWSPDGSALSFTSDRTGEREIYVISASNPEPFQVTNNASGEARSSWSPDGTMLVYAYANQDFSESGLYTINIDGTAETRLLTAPSILWASWSPDGEQIAYTVRDENNQFHIYLLDLNSSDSEQITFPTTGDSWYPSWSPDGSKIAFVSWGLDFNTDIYLMNADGTDQVRLTDIQSIESNPTWTSDGKYIIFSSDGDGDLEIYMMRPDGSNIIQLTNNSYDDSYPAWYPSNGSDC